MPAAAGDYSRDIQITAGDGRSTVVPVVVRSLVALGGRYGNKIARQLSVQTNPYAKACGAIVKEALRKEREEFAGNVDVGMEMGT